MNQKIASETKVLPKFQECDVVRWSSEAVIGYWFITMGKQFIHSHSITYFHFQWENWVLLLYVISKQRIFIFKQILFYLKMLLQDDNVFCVTMDDISILSLSSTYRWHVLLQESNTPRKHKCLSGEELQECVGGRKKKLRCLKTSWNTMLTPIET